MVKQLLFIIIIYYLYLLLIIAIVERVDFNLSSRSHRV